MGSDERGGEHRIGYDRTENQGEGDKGGEWRGGLGTRERIKGESKGDERA